MRMVEDRFAIRVARFANDLGTHRGTWKRPDAVRESRSANRESHFYA